MAHDWSEDDIGDQTGRTALVTGANTGIGYETARALARHGARVLFGCRDAARASTAVARVQESVPDADVAIVPLDLGDLSSIATAVLQVKGEDHAYEIPYRALLPKGLVNVATAGRGLSADAGAFAALRVMPNAMATGHAAGVAAALAVRANDPAFRAVAPAEVQTRLGEQSACLPERSEAGV